ncbi:MAG: dihydroorotate oxidase catalytic subunit [Chthonomonadales bacterium]|nr:dihydroorotate oxidase catalytic subunit [Chthonomonadales bacterium]
MAVMEMTTSLTSSLVLRTPVLAASGTFGYGDEVSDLADNSELGALITPTLTVNPRAGNPMPRTVEAHAGMLHALGLPNPGLESFIREIVPVLRDRSCPVIVSVWGERRQEWERLAAELTQTGVVAALEVNLMPANLLFTERSREAPLTEREQWENLVMAVTAVRCATGLPIIAKLPSMGLEIGMAARVAEEAGADCIAVSQAFPGVAVRLSAGGFRLPGVVGGLSGPAIKPLALYQVWRVAQCVTVPIIGSGGIMTADDALEFLMAGASAVSVGVAGLIHPGACASIMQGIRKYMTHNGVENLSAVVGAALRQPR